MKRKNYIVLIIVLLLLVLLVGNTHHILPSSLDPCQNDISHKDHIKELPMFHCIGHTEYISNPDKKGLEKIEKWDHIHSWMTLEWHVEQGFTKEHALDLIRLSSAELDKNIDE